MKKKSGMAVVFVLLAGILWGGMGLFVRRINAVGLFAFEVSQLRITLGMLLMLLYLLIFDREKLKVKLRDLWCFFGTGICSLLFFCWCYFTGLETESMAVMGVLLYTAPVFVLLFSAALFGEKLTGKKIGAIVMTVAGCCLVSGLGGGAQLSLRGFLLGLGSGFGYSLYSIFSRFAIKKGYGAWTITFYTFLFCSVGCAFFTDWPLLLGTVAVNPSIWPWIVALALLTGFGAYVLYTLGLEGMESGKASIVASVEPVVGTILGAVVFHEYLTALQIIGICLVLGAIVLLNLNMQKRRKNADFQEEIG